MSNAELKAKVKATGDVIKVYKLKEGTPTKDHIWCNCSGCTQTYTSQEIEFI